MRIQLYAYAFIGIVIAIVYVVFSIDRATNYKEVEAIVTDVDETCYLEKTERKGISKTTYTTDTGPCDELEMVKEVHPAYQGYRLVRETYVTFDYVSPVNGEWYSARHRLSKNSNGSRIEEGDRIPVLAHISEPGKTQRF